MYRLGFHLPGSMVKPHSGHLRPALVGLPIRSRAWASMRRCPQKGHFSRGRRALRVKTLIRTEADWEAILLALSGLSEKPSGSPFTALDLSSLWESALPRSRAVRMALRTSSLRGILRDLAVIPLLGLPGASALPFADAGVLNHLSYEPAHMYGAT